MVYPATSHSSVRQISHTCYFCNTVIIGIFGRVHYIFSRAARSNNSFITACAFQLLFLRVCAIRFCWVLWHNQRASPRRSVQLASRVARSVLAAGRPRYMIFLDLSHPSSVEFFTAKISSQTAIYLAINISENKQKELEITNDAHSTLAALLVKLRLWI
jgi:hypothetical protein